ncbi:hypothetical protein DFJ77DRAFT_162718 [Powellomyces hirtus]|nr:hypothetical protein DFJ77DRAFT_162718 [Powellomyces hirtus]
MDIVHHPIGYALTAGLAWAWVGTWMSRVDVVFGGQSWRDVRIVSRVGGRQWRRRRGRRRQDDGNDDDGDEFENDDAIGLAEEGGDNNDEEEEQTKDELDNSAGLGSQHLTLLNSWLLCVAGSLLHFRLDTLYEGDGQTPEYRWILSTGYWLPGANDIIYPSVGLAFFFSLSTLITAMLIVHTSLRTTLPLPTRVSALLATSEARLVVTAGTAMVVAVVYLFFVYSRMAIVPRVPAVGEEADFGVLVFEALTGILPLTLCAWVSR